MTSTAELATSDRPGETETERADRNFDDLLQELRVAQTGIQILLAFLLTVAFAPGFIELREPEHRLYGITVAVAASAMAFLVGPVACHRLSFRQHRKELVLIVAHWMTLIGLSLLALAVLGCVYLACWAALGVSQARVLTFVAGAALVVNWVILPLLVRRWTPPDD